MSITKLFAVGQIPGENPFYYIVGDTVWFHENASLDSDPSIAFIIAINEDSMVDLQVFSTMGPPRPVRRGVCLAGDSRLDKQVYRAKGCWRPRPTIHEVHNAMSQS